ncbi:predicted protein [Sclerotinia sclerotiorum 1980 UF-70]|uniref:Uncharacterized protein n=1 Tax=Sclerotinia sclerotiorum (strain ATCC 18683 / 1980 / Ss-1) TaxID=665079 RepID=A7F1I8_SCLS1|nr:predicted protein [Sclerotinia sclerotiorum 1980 UF-70]EDN95580.1 predicted protein [Sclerotinia sclerotiorum 1980 UF-70]
MYKKHIEKGFPTSLIPLGFSHLKSNFHYSRHVARQTRYFIIVFVHRIRDRAYMIISSQENAAENSVIHAIAKIEFLKLLTYPIPLSFAQPTYPTFRSFRITVICRYSLLPLYPPRLREIDLSLEIDPTFGSYSVPLSVIAAANDGFKADNVDRRTDHNALESPSRTWSCFRC